VRSYLLDANGQILRTVPEPETGANDLALDPANGGFYLTSPEGKRLLIGKTLGTRILDFPLKARVH